MTQWTDLFLKMPLPENWLHGLLFVAFGLHLLFVLLMLGTALLGLMFFLQRWFSRDKAPDYWNSRVVRSHLGLKSLAVVLGVAPLLIIQVRYSYGFFTVTGLFSYAWMAIIPLLIIAFLFIDAFAHTMEVHTWLAAACVVVGVGALLTVPAVFTGALSLMEREHLWPSFAAKGFFDLNRAYAVHWLLRYLHIVGAALVMGAAFHLFFSTREHPEKAPHLRNWLFGATLAQVVIGIPLVYSVSGRMNWPITATVTVGAAVAMLVLWVMRPTSTGLAGNGPRSLLVLLPVLLVAMLTSRQILQDRAVQPLHARLEAAEKARSEALAPYRQKALAAFQYKLDTVYDKGPTIYDGACQPCHGAGGRGDGPAASRLLVPAEDIAAIRADRDYIYAILKDGTPGSAMPYFRLYDRDKLERLMDTLSERFSMFAPPVKSPHRVGASNLRVWADTCSVCHGMDGGVSAFGRTLLPAPPDLRAYSLTHEHALAVITNGYPGTAMQPFRAYPAQTLEDLAVISNSFRVPAR